MPIGTRIRQLRRQQKLTQAELASRAGLYPTTISELERGVVQPGLSTLEAIAAALGITVSELVNDGDDKAG